MSEYAQVIAGSSRASAPGTTSRYVVPVNQDVIPTGYVLVSDDTKRIQAKNQAIASGQSKDNLGKSFLANVLGTIGANGAINSLLEFGGDFAMISQGGRLSLNREAYQTAIKNYQKPENQTVDNFRRLAVAGMIKAFQRFAATVRQLQSTDTTIKTNMDTRQANAPLQQALAHKQQIVSVLKGQQGNEVYRKYLQGEYDIVKANIQQNNLLNEVSQTYNATKTEQSFRDLVKQAGITIGQFNIPEKAQNYSTLISNNEGGMYNSFFVPQERKMKSFVQYQQQQNLFEEPVVALAGGGLAQGSSIQMSGPKYGTNTSGLLKKLLSQDQFTRVVTGTMDKEEFNQLSQEKQQAIIAWEQLS